MNRYGRLLSLFAVMAAMLALMAFIACESDDEAESDDGEAMEAMEATGDPREDTLQVILDRGYMICGIKADTPGFGVLNPDGSAVGNDVEYCHALAAAIFGDPSKVEFKEATSGNRFELLAAKEIDVLIRTTTWTASRTPT